MAFRLVPSIYVVTIPFFVRCSVSLQLTRFKTDYPQIYGLAFLFVGLGAPVTNSASRTWLQNVGTGLYSFASSSGSIYFALNFGDEGKHQFYPRILDHSNVSIQAERLSSLGFTGPLSSRELSNCSSASFGTGVVGWHRSIKRATHNLALR